MSNHLKIKVLTLSLLFFFGIGSSINFAQTDTLSGRYRMEVKKIIVPIEKEEGVLNSILYYLSPQKFVTRDTIIYTLIPIQDTSVIRSHVVETIQQQMISSESRSETEWARQLPQTNNTYLPPSESNEVKLNKIVYGYHPFWVGNAYKDYDFSLLTRVAYFSYSINPQTGGAQALPNWRESQIVELAHSKGCRVDLAVTNFGTANNAVFLSNIQAQNNFIDSIIFLLKEKGADGVHLNFEQVPQEYRSNYTNFIFNLALKLRKVDAQKFNSLDTTYCLSITLPAMDWREAFDVKGITSLVDFFIVMGYDFYGEGSRMAGPNSLMFSGSSWTDVNINNAINYYITEGVPKSKLILGVSYFGKEWETADGSVPSKALAYRGVKTYSEIVSQYSGRYTRNYDVPSMSSYYIYREDDKWIQCWLDDEISLEQKYNYVNGNDLAGVAIWALGYDRGYENLWKTLKNAFASPYIPLSPADSAMQVQFLDHSLSGNSLSDIVEKDPSFADRISNSIEKYLRVISLVLVLVVFFAVIGFVIAISDFNVRDVLLSTDVKVFVFFILLFSLIILVLRTLGILLTGDMILVSGLALGILATLFIIRMVQAKRSQPSENKP